ncbi:MAG TPA: VWA domain-containing protein [Longimicrobiales bacterium]|nr:VWA domain-containing protein [Longimicrobiales bacterium]
MTFLAPALLLLGLAAAVPLLLHLLQRQQGPRMVFPALRYLQRAEREHATRIRLRQVLLLALRVLALLLLALGAARPFLRGGGSGHEPTSVVIVLDNSLSSGAIVGDRRVLDGLKEAALATLGNAGGEDRFWLIRAGESWEPAVTGDAATVAAAVRRAEAAPGRGDLAAEVERAASILAGEPEGRAREVHVLSDLQATGLRRAAASDGTTPVVVLAPDAPPPPNRGVAAVSVGGGLPPRSGERLTVTAEVVGSGEAAHEDSAAGEGGTARLVVEGVVRAAARVNPGAAVVFALPAGEPGIVTGRVELDADALTDDDRRYFVARVSAPPGVALTDPLPFLAEAVSVLEDAGRIRRSAPGSADVVLAPGGVGADAARSGRGVVIFPPASVLELGAANQRLSAAGIPWRFGAPAAGEGRLQAREAEAAAALEETRLREVYGLEPQGAPADSVLLRLTTGEPWAVAGTTPAGGRYVLLATPLTPEASTIPTSAAMLPLLDRAIGAWAAGAAERAEHEPGDAVTLPAADSLVGPAGTVAPVADGTIHRLGAPGVYRALRGGETVAAYAVNSAAAESDLARVEPSDIAEFFPGWNVRVAAPGEWEDGIYVRRLGIEIAWPLVLLALLALVAESVVAATGRAAARVRTVPPAGGGTGGVERAGGRATGEAV